MVNVREKSGKMKRVEMARKKSGNWRKKKEKSGKVKELYSLSQDKRFDTPQVHLDDLGFCQNAISGSHGKFSEVREKSGKSQGK